MDNYQFLPRPYFQTLLMIPVVLKHQDYPENSNSHLINNWMLLVCAIGFFKNIVA